MKVALGGGNVDFKRAAPNPTVGAVPTPDWVEPTTGCVTTIRRTGDGSERMNDLKFAIRQLLKHPAFSALAIMTFALGIGLVTTQFSLIDAILLRGLPIEGAQRLVHVYRLNPQTLDVHSWESVPYRDYLAFQKQQTTLDTVAAVGQVGLNISGHGSAASHHEGAQVTANLLDVLGVHPELGRWFVPGEDQPGQGQFAIVSHGFWQSHFAGDPGVLGRSINLNGEAATIIGVMPPRFSFPATHEIWMNLRESSESDPRVPGSLRVEMVGRLKPEVTLSQAKAEFNTIAQRLEKEHPDTNLGYSRMNVTKYAYAYSGNGTEPILYLMLAMTSFILLLACVNVANMLLARAARRARELAVRAAVGASRWRLIRQLLIEALLLASFGAVGGLLIANLGVDQLQHHIVERMNVPGWFDFRIDYRVAGFAMLLTLLAGLLAGGVPAWQAARVDLNSALKDESRGASGIRMGRISRWLVTAQVGFACALLIGVCITLGMVRLLQKANLDYAPDRLLSGRIELQDSTHPTKEIRAGFYRNLLTELAGQPGVAHIAVSSRNLITSGVSTRVAQESVSYDHENQHPTVWLEVVSEGYFSLLNFKPIQGRLFESIDRLDRPMVAVVNQSFARRLWPNSDPLGQRFRTDQTADQWVTVIGVVPDARMQGIFAPGRDDGVGFYLAQDQMGWGWLTLLVRTEGDPSRLIDPMRLAVGSLDPNQPVHTIGTLAEHTARQIRGFTVVGAMAGIFALVTLFLGAVGVYGVTSFAVGQRTREFGVRMALGASIRSVLALVILQAGRQILTGIGIGLLLAFLITRPMVNVFVPEIVNNPMNYALVAGLILAVGFFAIWFPANRAARIDPMEALRAE